jgi:hypothetical protein
VLAAVVATFAGLNATGNNPLPGSVPVIGRTADSIFNKIENAGLPITDGVPADAKFRSMTRNNACKSSRSFVRSDAESGWGLICVAPPHSVYRRISRAFDGVPMLMGPLYVDDGDGDLVIFGFGWPPNASKQIAKAAGAEGSYLVDPR